MAEQVLRQRRVPGNKGLRYPADPPTVEEIVAVMRHAGDAPSSFRIRALIVVLWRAGLRISEALVLNETDLDPGAGSILVRFGKGGRRQPEPGWLGPQSCVLLRDVGAVEPETQLVAGKRNC